MSDNVFCDPHDIILLLHVKSVIDDNARQAYYNNTEETVS